MLPAFTTAPRHRRKGITLTWPQHNFTKGTERFTTFRTISAFVQTLSEERLITVGPCFGKPSRPKCSYRRALVPEGRPPRSNHDCRTSTSHSS